MSRTLLCVSAIVGLAMCAPQGARDESPTTTTQVPILKQINKVNDDGSYTFGYEAADGTFKVETRDARGNINGRYGFVDPEGNLKVVDYTAGNDAGFVAKADHIPVAPFPLPAPSGSPGAADLPSIPLAEIAQAKERIQQTNAEEDFSTDADENGIPDALENVIPNLRASAPGPVAQVATSPVAVSAPEPQQQQVDPVFDAVQQTPVTNVQSDPNTFIQRTPQGFQFSFVAPTQNANHQQLQQARALPLTLPQFQFGQFQPQPFQPQSFQFSPQFAAFN